MTPQLRQLNDAQIHTAQALSQALWGGQRTLEERLLKLKAQMSISQSPLTYWGLVGAQGEVLSSCKLYDCVLSCQAKDLRALSIGAVFTADELRGHGYARILLEQVAELAQKRAYSALFLWSDIGDKFYKSLSYQAFPLRKFSLPAAELTSQAPQPFFTRPAAPEDLAFRMNLYEAQARFVQLHVRRDAIRWDFFRALNDAAPDQLVCRDDGQPAGYFSAHVSTGATLVVAEAFALPGMEDTLRAAVGQYAAAHACSTLSYWPQPFGLLPATDAAVDVAEPLPMVRFFSPVASNLQACFLENDHF